ncbi:F11 receptor, tandem duplicate 1 isoform 2-T2 [Spinachia spinachia]
MVVGWLVSVPLFWFAATGTDLACSYSGDFGSNPRVEWKFKNLKGSQMYVFFDRKLTTPYVGRVTMYGNNLRFSKVTTEDNGVYTCEVSANAQFGGVQVRMTVLVAPGKPLVRVPSSVTTGRSAMLTCHDSVGSPPSKYKWYKDDVLLPSDPSKNAAFKNATYKLNTENGNLEFPSAVKMDTAQYTCEAFNGAGPDQLSKPFRMEVRDLNAGGIVAGVLVALLLVALLVFGIWYAKKKGYLPKKTESKPKPSVVYQAASSVYGGGEADDGEFKQKSSFVV